MVLVDLATMQAWALLLAVLASTAGLVNVLLGLYSSLSGMDHWPKSLRHLRRQTPSTEDDVRAHGVAMTLNGGAVLLVVLALSMVVIEGRSRIGEPMGTLVFAIMSLGIAGSLALAIGANAVGRRVRYAIRGISGQESPRT